MSRRPQGADDPDSHDEGRRQPTGATDVEQGLYLYGEEMNWVSGFWRPAAGPSTASDEFSSVQTNPCLNGHITLLS